jgi:hypothetical protein
VLTLALSSLSRNLLSHKNGIPVCWQFSYFRLTVFTGSLVNFMVCCCLSRVCQILVNMAALKLYSLNKPGNVVKRVIFNYF